MHVERLSYNTPDKNHVKPPVKLIGRELEHTGNNKVYTIIGFTWLGESDTWGFMAQCHPDGPDAVVVTRPIEHLYGNRSNGAKRYIHK